MDNLSQEEIEIKKEIERNFYPQNFGSQEGEDIEFDENINIEDIQKILQQHMDEEKEELSASFQGDFVDEISEEFKENEIENTDVASYPDYNMGPADETSIIGSEAFPQLAAYIPQELQNQPTENDPNSKKYVIYIDSDNIEFIEKLSINERKLIINKILKEQNELIQKQKAIEAKSKFIKHATASAMTAIIGFPLLFMLVNKSLELTISNYKESQKNFSILYREQGKIKQIEKTPVKKH